MRDTVIFGGKDKALDPLEALAQWTPLFAAGGAIRSRWRRRHGGCAPRFAYWKQLCKSGEAERADRGRDAQMVRSSRRRGLCVANEDFPHANANLDLQLPSLFSPPVRAPPNVVRPIRLVASSPGSTTQDLGKSHIRLQWFGSSSTIQMPWRSHHPFVVALARGWFWAVATVGRPRHLLRVQLSRRLESTFSDKIAAWRHRARA